MTEISIAVNHKTADRLKRYGIRDSTYDSILNNLMDHIDLCNAWYGKEE
ncbi:MAG: hypothetical protein IIC67_04215 [Thaumarchaeota archaeon]|nr:hypothetical protein [Nitrososphaerota archaeon]